MRTRDLDEWAVQCFGGEGHSIFFFYYYYYHKNKIKLHNDDVYNARRASSLRVSSLNRRRVRGRPEFRDENIIKTHIRRNSSVYNVAKRSCCRHKRNNNLKRKISRKLIITTASPPIISIQNIRIS